MMRQLSWILLIFLSLACLASVPAQAAPVAFDWLEAPADELALEDVRALPPGVEPQELIRQAVTVSCWPVISGRRVCPAPESRLSSSVCSAPVRGKSTPLR